MTVTVRKDFEMSPTLLASIQAEIPKRGVRRLAKHVQLSATCISRLQTGELATISIEALCRIIDSCGIMRALCPLVKSYSVPGVWPSLPEKNAGQGELFTVASAVQLRSCKRCSGEAIVYIRSREIIRGEPERMYRVECEKGCRVTGRYYRDELGAKLSWNRRNR